MTCLPDSERWNVAVGIAGFDDINDMDESDNFVEPVLWVTNKKSFWPYQLRWN